MGLTEMVAAGNLPVHVFFGFLHVWLNDSEGLGSVAGSRVVTNYGLDATAISEANAIKSKFDGLGTAVAKVEFVDRIHAAFMLLESGDITDGEAKTLLGF